MTPELFKIPESLSPKLIWLCKHGLSISYDPRFDTQPLQESPETGADIYPWVCYSLSLPELLRGYGITEDQAIIDYCLKNDLKHWTQERTP